MQKFYPETKQLDLPAIELSILTHWETQDIFKQSIATRKNSPDFVFYEGPPSANGMPGIHHVMSRTLKDLFCRYKTLKGFKVERKGGWDTHGLPIELAVEKRLGIKKEDIGEKISVAEYNAECRKEVLKFKEAWDDLTRKMGYWVDLENPYITYENEYIETLWWILKQLYNKGLIYKGYTIQPYSPAAGTGLSSHELNLPGCYRNVKDTSATVMFKTIPPLTHPLSKNGQGKEIFFLAWTTTPWTLPSNCALAVGTNIEYVLVNTLNPYTGIEINVVLAKKLFTKYFSLQSDVNDLTVGLNRIVSEKERWTIVGFYKGSDLVGIRYEQLLPYAQPESGDNFKVVGGDFVSTEDGTGIVHIAPSFGADDMRVGKQNGVGTLTLVDKRGKFLPEVKDDIFLYGDEYVKEAYLTEDEKQVEFEKQKKILEAHGKIKELKNYLNVDERIVLKLQEENKLFKKEKYEHNYPHCWRTDKPILYYPLDSWFIKTTAVKDRMVELNKTINWKPESTGTGRFGNWLENLVDWNLSRSRFWGTPLPIWRTEDGTEEICIGSVEELNQEIEKSKQAGFMDASPIGGGLEGAIDLHKPFVDEIILVSPSGKKMMRESDLIDVWFDSGAMPYAQWHYPFENQEKFKHSFPADFISEGVDQTRGWFFTLHAIATLLFDSVAYKNVVSNGLVLDKNGNKMSKRWGNTVEPFETIAKYGADATRWYMITNAQPWDNLKFDLNGIDEVQRKFFGTLFNTYAFFALYANIDRYQFNPTQIIPLSERTEIDRWIISQLNALIVEVENQLEQYEPTKAGRAIQQFVDAQLSNWYVRLSRRRFWKGEMNHDKQAAFDTLYECLHTLSILSAPIAPFFSDWLYQNLGGQLPSVHLADFPKAKQHAIDTHLNDAMNLAQEASSLILALRRKANIKVRQPLNKVLIPSKGATFNRHIQHVAELIKSEVNVKHLEIVNDLDVAEKSIKPNYRNLGKIFGKKVPQVVEILNQATQQEIKIAEKNNTYALTIDNKSYMLSPNEYDIITSNIPGWELASSPEIEVALDISIDEHLKDEGNAREIINKIQNLRKEKNFNVTDRIFLKFENNSAIIGALNNFKNYICSEVLAEQLYIESKIDNADTIEINENPIKLIVELKN